jgi:hypothetical protein
MRGIAMRLASRLVLPRCYPTRFRKTPALTPRRPLSFGARVHFVTSRDSSLEDIARGLARTPILPLNGTSPIELTLARFENG